MTRLDFVGDWPLPAAVAAACIFGAGAFLLYRRILGERFRGMARLLPFIRAAVIALVVLMLGGPVLKHRRVHGSLTRLNLVFDGSLSMQLTDPQMPEARKARIAARFGWIPEGVVPPQLALAEDTAAHLRDYLDKIVEGARAGKLEESLFKQARESAEGLRRNFESTGIGRETTSKYERDVLEPLKHAAAARGDALTRASTAWVDKMSSVGRNALAEVEALIRAAVLRTLEANPAAKQAVERVGNTPRWQRLQTLLSTGADKGLVTRLRTGFDLRVRKIEGRSEVLFSDDLVAASPTLSYLGAASGTCTDLGSALERDLDTLRSVAKNESLRSLTVLVSDGQFNAGVSPVLPARRLGDRKSPVFTVGVGAMESSPDLAMKALNAPMRAVRTDRIRGSFLVREEVAPGVEYQVRIRHGHAVVWEQTRRAGDTGTHTFPFEIALEALLAAHGEERKSAQGLVRFDAEIEPLPGERETRNNSAKFTVQVIDKKRSILILDSEPRWDMRYLRNLFERDSQWQVNALIRSGDGDASKSPWERGDKAGTYPATREVLSKYDIVVLGDVPAAWLTAEEVRHLSEHVAEAGAGLVLVDGDQGRLKEWLAGPLGAAIPVEFAEGGPFRGAETWTLSAAGIQNPLLSLHGDPTRVADGWKRLPVPKRLSRVRPGAGAEVLLFTKGADGEMPFLTTRQFGAGRVVHLASDETWRWRIDVGGELQGRFWNQLVSWVAEPPFSAEGTHVSVDSDKPVYRPGERARFRVKILDASGRPVMNTRSKLLVFRDGVRISELPLSAAPGRPGIYSADFSVDAEGSFEVGVDTAGGEAEAVRARFEVETAGDGELASLRMNEPLLRELAASSGGTFLLEEQLGRIEELIRPFLEGEVIESETVLWTSYGWLSGIVLLLCLEWVIRKRLGMI